MGLFDTETDPLGGASLDPSSVLDDQEAAAPVPGPVSLPDITPIVSAMPRQALPPPAPLPNPNQMTDPKARLMALFTAGFAMGAGPNSGVGAGALAGLQHIQEQKHQEALRQWQVNENQRQQQARIIEQQNAELDRQRAVSLQRSLQAFSQAATQAETKEDYDKLADAYGNGLTASGFRITPNWLRANVPWQAPNRIDKIKRAVTKWKANPNNQRLLDADPMTASKSPIVVDDGVPMPLGQALDAIGEGFAKDPSGGILIAPKPLAGTSPFDVKLNALMDQWRLENPGKVLDPKSKNDLIDNAIQASKEKAPESELDTALKQALLRDRNRQPDKLTKVEHKDPSTGKTVIEWIPESQLQGRAFEKGTNAVTENRLASAQAVNQTGQDIIAKLQDPAYSKAVGVAMGRFNSMRDFIGNPPPEFAELAGMIESYSLANMGVHGMRSSQGAEMIKKLLDQKHTPESLIATIKGLNQFSQHFMDNEGRQTTTPTKTQSALDAAKAKLNGR